jgi:hypothetical protein
MRTLTLTIVTLFLAAVPANAQANGNPHRGFWIGFGLGGGVNVSTAIDGEELAGGTGYLRLGGTPHQQWLLGFEAIGWGRGRDGTTLARGNASFVTMFYPSKQGGLFVKGAVGGSSLSWSGSTTITTTEYGFGTTLGLGYDVRLGRNIYLTPAADWLFQAFDSEDPALPGTNNILMVTLGILWH